MATTKPITTHEGIYINPSAAIYTHERSTAPEADMIDPAKIKAYHESLPNFNTTSLHNLPSLASSLGLQGLLIKSESSRLGLPAFKILGASWGVYRALCRELDVVPDPNVMTLEVLKERLGQQGSKGRRYVLFAATDGNHGRAVARMARILLPDQKERAMIYVPEGMYETTKKLIEGEGAEVVTVNGDYDKAVEQCWKASKAFIKSGKGVGLMVQDNAFGEYRTVPGWIVDGYSTLLSEVDDHFAALQREFKKPITHVITPIGVGSLGKAVVKWAKTAAREHKVRVIACEPETAACLNVSLKAGENTTIETIDTIMSGMCCGTVSPTSWEALRDGVDASVTVGDWECHQTVLELLDKYVIEAGPCGAGCLTALSKVLDSEEARSTLNLGKDSIVVVLSTEGRREYPVPQRS